MEDNEIEVLNNTENVEEQATEELVEGTSVSTTEAVNSELANTKDEKKYTDADVDKLVNERLNKILPSKIERAKNKISRDYEEKYEKLNRVLSAGLQTDNVEEQADKLEEFYTTNGINIPERSYNERESNYIVDGYAKEVIDAGYDEIVSEVDRLAKKGESMNKQEKMLFMKLSSERKNQEDLKELAKIGVTEADLNNSDFQEFASKLNPNLSAKDKYEMYKQIKPKQKYEQIGSLKNTSGKNQEVKDFYSFEEASKFTKADFDKNPKLFKAVCDSMSKWNK